MAENVIMSPWSQICESRQIRRGILKASRRFDEKDDKESISSKVKSPRFDENNIIATLHTPEKGYGFNSGEKKPDPSKFGNDVEGDENRSKNEDAGVNENAESDTSMPIKRLLVEHSRPMCRRSPSADKEDFELLSDDEKEKRRQFELKRKAYSDEYHAVKLARQLIETDEDSLQDAADVNKEGMSKQAIHSENVATTNVPKSLTSQEVNLHDTNDESNGATNLNKES